MVMHAVEPEELHAYLDGEIEPARQAEVERHLGECPRCAALLADLKRVSETLHRWQVEPAPESLGVPGLETASPPSGARALQSPGLRSRRLWRRIGYGLAGAAALAVFLFAVGVADLVRPPAGFVLEESREQAAVSTTEQAGGTSGDSEELAPPAEINKKAEPGAAPGPTRAPVLSLSRRPAAPARVQRERSLARKEGSEQKPPEGETVGGLVASVPAGTPSSAYVARDALAGVEGFDVSNALRPKQLGRAAGWRKIAYRASMTVEAKEFEAAREKALKAVTDAGGYLAQASVAETPDQPRRAELVLRVPAEKLSVVMEQIRALGRVLQEQISTEEVTEQVVDLDARLRNARATEQRLLAVLEKRTGQVRDILEVEREIAATREEIERMQARRQNLLHRVALATLTVTLTEEFQAMLTPAPAGAGTRLRNAFVEGYENFVGLLLGLVLFFARYGPALLFWSGVAWLGWRRLRQPVLKLLRT